MTINELQQKILSLKKEKRAAIFAHSYQRAEILEIADFIGDSFALSVEASKSTKKTIILCGVRFMADTVKILSPEKTVILPNPQATCPMAEQITSEFVMNYKKSNPNAVIAAYVNTSTELKAVSDVCVTSSSALKIISRLKAEDILFIPDKNLGSYIKSNLPDKNITLADGKCPVHDAVTPLDCEKAKKSYPGIKILAHPELPPEVLSYADYIGATSGIIEYALSHDEDFIIGTENAISDYLNLIKPERNFYPLSTSLVCCDMKLTTLTDIYRSLLGTSGEKILISETLRLAAKKPIDRMIELGA